MRYVIAGYTIILSLLFLYALQLVWRRQRLTRAQPVCWDSMWTGSTRSPSPVRPPSLRLPG